LADARGQMIEIVNEGTIPVIGEENLDRVYRIDNTADITTLTEMSFDIKTPDLEPVELGTYIYLKRKQVEQYPQLKLDQLFVNKISSAVARTADKISLKGDTLAVGSTNPLNVADGIEKLALAANASATPVDYTTSDAQDILDAVSDAKNDLGVYADDEMTDDLVLFASPDFCAAAAKSADKNMVGYEIGDYAPLGLKRVVFLHGVPLVRRSALTGEKAILANVRGMFAGYYGNMEVDVEHKAGRRSDLLVITYWFDFKWAYLNGSNKSNGLVTIEKAS
jgi:hypothetical protein